MNPRFPILAAAIVLACASPALAVTDARTGAIKTYTNLFGTLASAADVLAF